MTFPGRFLAKIVEPLRAWNGRLIYGVAARVPPTGPDGTVTAEVACRRCGYNLRGLHVGGRCPDCALPVGVSVRGDDLAYADPEWIAKLVLGTNLLIAGWTGAALAIVAAFAFYPAAYAFAALAAAGVVGGTWLLTRPDASGTGEAWYGRSRRGARALAILTLAMPALAGVIDSIASTAMPAGTAFILRRANFHLAFLAAYAALLALLAFVRSFVATRVRDWELAQTIRRTFWEIAVELGSAGGILAYVTLVQRRSMTTPVGDRPVTLAAAAVSLILLWSLVQLVKLMLKVRAALKTQEAFARQLWPPPSRAAAPTGPPD
jgi:hypothetical protein